VSRDFLFLRVDSPLTSRYRWPGLESTDNVTDETRPKILRAFELLSSLYPRASAPRRIALNFATGSYYFAPASTFHPHANTSSYCLT